MTVIYATCFVLLFGAAVLALIRLERGPSMFDRIFALDLTTAIILGTIAVIAAITRRADLIPVLIVLTLVGFVGSVSIARFAVLESADEARILTKDELRQILAEREASTDDDDAPPVHDVEDAVVIAVLDVDEGPHAPGADHHRHRHHGGGHR